MTQAAYIRDVKGLYGGTQAGWGGAASGTERRVKAFDIEFKPKINPFKQKRQKPFGATGPDASILGAYGGELTFKQYLQTPGGVTPAAGSEFMLPGRMMCNVGLTHRTLPADTDLVSGSTTTMLDTAINLADYEVGDGVFIKGAVTPQQLRWVTSKVISTNSTLTIAPALVAPGAVVTDDLYANDTFFPRYSSLGEPVSYMYFVLVCGNDAYHYHLTDCAGTFKISCDAAGLPLIEWTYQVGTWTYTASAAGSFVVKTDPFPDPYPIMGCPLFIDGVELKVRSLSFDPGLKLVPYESMGGSQGRAGWLYVEASEPKVSIDFLFDGAFITKWTGKTTFDLAFTAIKDTDEFWGLHIPAVQVLDIGLSEVNGHEGVKPEFQICDPGMNSDFVRVQLPLWQLTIAAEPTL
jgi:hypothetical protein